MRGWFVLVSHRAVRRLPGGVAITRWGPFMSAISPTTAWSVCCSILGVILLSPQSAVALPFTLESPVVLTGSEPGNPGVLGTLLPVALGSAMEDPLGIQTGDTSFATNDVFVVQLELVTGSSSVDQVQITTVSNPFMGNPVGAGIFSDSGDQAPDQVSIPIFGLRADFGFSPNLLEAGELSTRLFVTYAPVGSALAIGQTASFTISSGLDFTVQGTIVPEPSTGLLVWFGLVGGAALRRQRSFSR